MAKFNVNLSDVQEGGYKILPKGDYVCKVTKIDMKDGKAAKYLEWHLVVGVGPCKGQKIIERTSLSPKALWRLKAVIVALGIEIPKKAFQIDTSKYVGKIIGITVEETTYTKDGVEKPTNEITELWEVSKDDSGKWGRKNAVDAEEAIDELGDSEEDPVDGAEEIEI